MTAEIGLASNRVPVPIKTTKAVEELRKRRYGLTPRLRQLLILVDGRRDVTELARFFPARELLEGLEVLLREGFVSDGRRLRHRGDDRLADSDHEPAMPVLSDATVPGAAGDADTTLDATRQRLERSLVGAIGDEADVFVERLAACRDIDEIRDLMPAILAIIEVLRGPGDARDFADSADPL